MVYIKHPGTGRKFLARALLDNGANITMITRRLAKKLRLKGVQKVLSIAVAGGQRVRSAEQEVQLKICSIDGTFETPYNVVASTVDIIGPPFDPVVFDPGDFPHLDGIQFTEKYPIFTPRPFDVLIAEPYYSQLMNEAQRKGQLHEPTAKSTQLGWALRGAIPSTNYHAHTARIDEDVDISARGLRVKANLVGHDPDPFDKTLWKRSMVGFPFVDFWRAEMIGISSRETDIKDFTELELRALQMQRDVSYQDPVTGKWQTEFLWKDPDPEFRRMADNTMAAIRVMHKVEAEKNMDYKQLIKDAYQYLIDARYVEIVPADEFDPEHPVYVLTSRAEVRPERKTTKARIVINASKPDPTGKTLNSCLMTGPNLLPQVSPCIMKGREHQHIFTIDIKKMFFQVELHRKQDRDMARFYWGNFTGKPTLYRYRVLPFGCVSSPFQAIWCLQETARKHQKEYPEAAKVILSYLYMDDICTGASDPKDAAKLLKDLLFLITEAGFEGHKISSNHIQILKSIPEGLRDESDTIKILGLKFTHSKDTFQFDLDHKFEHFDANAEYISRRQCVSLGAQVFDTQGFVAPFIMRYKQILPELWFAGIEWDDNLLAKMKVYGGTLIQDPAALKAVQIFREWVSQIPLLKELSFPRWVGGPIQYLVAFSDASKAGIAATVYTVALTEKGELYPLLAFSKTTLMPKTLRPGQEIKDAWTIARAELAGMKIAVTAGQYVARSHDCPYNKIYYLCDSLLNLQRLQRDIEKSLRWEYNRLEFIKSNLEGGTFGFVPGKENPADLPSRGCELPELLARKDFWTYGPDFLKKPVSEWPKQPVVAKNTKQEVEASKELQTYHKCYSVQKKVIRAERITKARIREATKWHTLIEYFLERHCKLDFIKGLIITLMRTRAIMLQHKGSGKIFQKSHVPEMKKPKTLREYRLAENHLVKYAQQKHYMKEIFILQNRSQYEDPNHPDVLRAHPFHKDSRLRHFTCFYDKATGLIRLGTRLMNSRTCSTFIARPILLPQGRVAELIIKHAHLVNRHMSRKQTWAYIRERYWLQGGKQYVQDVLKTCMKAKCPNPRFFRPQMSPLPPFRADQPSCWMYVGVDYAGPLNVKHQCINKNSTIRNTPDYKFSSMSKANRDAVIEELVANCPHHYQDTKVWLVFFTCLHTRSIHIEIVEECSTMAFMFAVRTFMGHHGVPVKFYSDNAGYFKKADKELKALLKSIDFTTVNKDMYLGEPVQWEFSTPEAPWTAGIIERIIGLFKKLFRIAINQHTNLNLRAIKTITSEVMSILNNRPLDAEVDANGGLEPITPNKLVYGRNLKVLNTPSPDGIRKREIAFKDEWLERKQVLGNFWKKWSQQYLNQLSIQNKWTDPENVDLKVDDIVLVRDETVAQGSWNIARVKELHRDSKGNITKALVILNTKSEVWRHLRQLALLESTMDARTAPPEVFTEDATEGTVPNLSAEGSEGNGSNGAENLTAEAGAQQPMLGESRQKTNRPEARYEDKTGNDPDSLDCGPVAKRTRAGSRSRKRLKEAAKD